MMQNRLLNSLIYQTNGRRRNIVSVIALTVQNININKNVLHTRKKLTKLVFTVLLCIKIITEEKSIGSYMVFLFNAQIY